MVSATRRHLTGDIVSFLISSINRGQCNNKRIPCIFKEAKQKAYHILYILQCKFGIVDQGYLAKEIELDLGAFELIRRPKSMSIPNLVIELLLLLFQTIQPI